MLRRRALAFASLLACAFLVVAATGVAAASNPSAKIPIPRHNIPPVIPSGPHAACTVQYRSASCERAWIVALDAARAKLGLGPYRLPANFVTLASARQFLILADLDRRAYSMQLIVGLAAPLDAIAEKAARAGPVDPDPDPFLVSHGYDGAGTFAVWASDAAGGPDDPAEAYYQWMYNDGYGAFNLDCRSPKAPGCWGHRRTILSFSFPHSHYLVAMGAAVVRPNYTLTVVASTKHFSHYVYTWAQAKADGA